MLHGMQKVGLRIRCRFAAAAHSASRPAAVTAALLVFLLNLGLGPGLWSRPALAETAPNEDVVVEVSGKRLNRAEIEEVIRAEMPSSRRALRNKVARRDFIEQQIDLELLAAEAERRGLAADSEVRRVLRHVLARRLVDRETEELPGPTDAELRSTYEKNSSRFSRPAQRRVVAIVLTGNDARVLARAAELQADAQAAPGDADHFRKLVQRFSQDAKTRAQSGGASPYFARDDEQVPNAIREAAFAMSVGDVRVVTVGGNVQVLRLIGRRGAWSPTFEQARDRVRRFHERLRRERLEAEILQKLRKTATIRIDEKALGRVRVAP